MRVIFLLITSCIIITSHICIAQDNDSNLLLPYDESVFIISNYSGIYAQRRETRSIDELLELNIGGFRFHITWNEEKKIVYDNSKGQKLYFTDALESIKNHLDKNPQKVITLFLDLEITPNQLARALRDAELFDHLHLQDRLSDWPIIKELISSDKRLVIFSMNRFQRPPAWLHYVWDFAVEPYFSLFEAPNFIGEFLRGDPKNSLLILNDFNLPLGWQGKEKSFDTNTITNPYLVEHALDVWRATGKVPNFIMMDYYIAGIGNVAYRLAQFKTIKGLVSYNMKPLDYVGWSEIENSLTNGKYSFPIAPGDKILLKPESPGFKFTPESVFFDEPDQNIIQNFKAEPYGITENLLMYIPFDNDLNDYSISKNHGSPENISLIEDELRGHVGHFDGSGRMKLRQADELKMKNSNFTVAAWIKMEENDQPDNIILGTMETAYQVGLHLTIRNKKPYFGFFSNDLQGNSTIKEGIWHHIVFRYNKLNGEQAIFINGKLDSKSVGHPPFQGKAELYLGDGGFEWKDNFNGYIDDFCIWNRPLGDEEIWNLYQDLVLLNPEDGFNVKRTLLLSGIVVLLLTISFILWRLLTPKKVALQPNDKQTTLAESNKALQTQQEISVNGIWIFGDFKVLSANGEDITVHFTPKLKKIFLLILLHTVKSKKGISTNELTDTIWPGQDNKNAKNSRGVSIRKLRLILENMEGVEIVFQRENWTLKTSEKVYVDYLEVIRLLDNPAALHQDEIRRIFEIVKGGQIVQNESYHWLDDFRAFIDNKIIDTLLKFISEHGETADNDIVLQMADRILKSDPVNEEALRIKLQILIQQDNSNYARYSFETFRSVYKEMYGESFSNSFEEFTKEPDNQAD